MPHVLVSKTKCVEGHWRGGCGRGQDALPREWLRADSWTGDRSGLSVSPSSTRAGSRSARYPRTGSHPFVHPRPLNRQDARLAAGSITQLKCLLSDPEELSLLAV